MLQALDIERVEQQGMGEIRKSTITGLWKPVLAFLGDRRDVSTLAVTDLDAYEAHRRASDVKGQTIRREVQAVVRGLKMARRAKMIHRLPFDPEDLREIDSDAPDQRQRAKEWSAAEIRKVLGALSRKAVTAGWRDRLRFIQLTGLRLEEVRRLDPKTWVRGAELHVPASGAKTITGARAITLSPEARNILKRWKTVRGKPNKALELACSKAKMRAVLTPRDIRSWWITQVARYDVAAAQRLAGHTSLKTTSRYVHADAGRQRAAARSAAEAAGAPTRRSPQKKRKA